MLEASGVANGYFNNPELTQKSFVKNPFGGGYLYRTGDLAKYRNDGEIEYIGRSDEQIKLRGLRIELGEIEKALLQYPNMKKATVVKKALNNRDFLVAYFTTSKKIITTELRKYLSGLLPKYMVPSYYVALADFPYTTSGKIDKKQLPMPTNASHSQKDYVAPQTKLQETIVGIWENILNIKPISIYDNFFDLGGDSILAMSLHIELLKITDKISYSDIFQHPTIAELEERIRLDKQDSFFQKVENLPDSYVDILKNAHRKEKIQEYHPDSILLTGSTGYLGIHILEEFLKNQSGKIYCIVRQSPGVNPEKRLLQKLHYYFGNQYDDLMNTRIFAINGDISEPNFGLDNKEFSELANSIDLVVHSAGRVAHYGNYEEFYKTNVQSVKYIVDFCKTYHKKLYHISTLSVSGMKIDKSYLAYKKKKNHAISFSEESLYIGQLLDNVYIHTKFEAENYILNAISEGLDGYILRMGNLMPRYKDGVFQENILDNAFVNKLATFIKIGIIPDYMLHQLLNFTPIDYAAAAVYHLVTHPTDKNRVFHIYNHHNIATKKYLKTLKNLNYPVRIISEKEFKDTVNSMLSENATKDLLKNLLDDFNNDLHLDYGNDIIMKSKFTTKYLKKTHFKWPKISKKYLDNFTKDVIGRVI